MHPRHKAVWYAALRAAFFNSLALQRRGEMEDAPPPAVLLDQAILSAFIDALIESGEKPGSWRDVRRLGISRVEYKGPGCAYGYRYRQEPSWPNGWDRMVLRSNVSRDEYEETAEGELVLLSPHHPPDGVAEGTTHLPANLRRGGADMVDFRIITGNGDVWEVDFHKMARPRRVLKRATRWT